MGMLAYLNDLCGQLFEMLFAIAAFAFLVAATVVLLITAHLYFSGELRLLFSPHPQPIVLRVEMIQVGEPKIDDLFKKREGL